MGFEIPIFRLVLHTDGLFLSCQSAPAVVEFLHLSGGVRQNVANFFRLPGVLSQAVIRDPFGQANSSGNHLN